MALATSVTGTGKLISYDPGENLVYFIAMAGGGRNKYTMTTSTTVREWYALTESAASTWCNDVDPPWATGESRKMERVSNVATGEYKVTQTIVTKSLTFVFIPPEE